MDLYRSSPKLRERTPIDASDLDEAINLASSLYPRLGVAGSTVEVPKEDPGPAIDFRDRIWTLLLGDWDELFVLATMQWKTKVGRHLPPLQARAQVKRASPSEGNEELPQTTESDDGSERSRESEGDEDSVA